MVLVDSSIWIESERARGDLNVKWAVRQLLEHYAVVLCSPVRLEVLGGAQKSFRGRWQTFFSILPYEPLQEAHWRQASVLAWKMRDLGQTLPWNDLLVAALALDKNIRVYAKDAHFDLLHKHAGVRLYQPGYGGAYTPDA